MAAPDLETLGSTAVETTVLIIGAGPAGASLASFLASYGLKGIVVSAASGTAKEPRAHITNPAALECLRDIGLEEEAKMNATSGDCMTHTRWGHDMAGEEFARIYSWGNQPDRKGNYESASPCRHVDLPQTLLEPILVKYAVANGWNVRFDSAFIKYERSSPDGLISSLVQDKLTGQSYIVRSKYLLGCDGARSQVMRQLGLPLIKEPGQGLALNVLVDANLSKHMEHRGGNLHWNFTPEIVHPPWGWTALVRMVKAWHQWMFIFIQHPENHDKFEVQPSFEEYEKRVKEFIGDDTIPVKIVDASKWMINEIVAERYSDGNILCLGDAVHRHPPFNGLGSNTCIQDAWNLAWKLAYVEKGLAEPSLLDSYSLERQPIGAGVIKRANQGLRDHLAVWEALGVLPTDVDERVRQHAELKAPTPEGRARRKRLRTAIDYTAHEFGGIGQEMNQRYESAAIYLADENEPPRPVPKDAVLEHQISTYPGSRLPHVWLNTKRPGTPISTIDLAGHGAFCVLTGIGGEAWKEAASHAMQSLGVKVNAYSIGWSQDWEDVYGDWDARREIEEDGCLLVRPDRTIAWRAMRLREDATSALVKVLQAVLGRK